MHWFHWLILAIVLITIVLDECFERIGRKKLENEDLEHHNVWVMVSWATKGVVFGSLLATVILGVGYEVYL